MKFFICVAFVFASIAPLAQSGDKHDFARIRRGETLQYKIKYGWFKIGEAEVKIDSRLHFFNNEPHYHIHFNLKAHGLLALFSNLNLDLDSFVHSETFRPNRSVQTVRYGKRENSYFDDFFYADSIYVQYWKNQNEKEKFVFEETDVPFVDALGSYLLVKTMDLNMSEPKNMQLYYGKEVYDFGITPDKSLISSSDHDLKAYQIRLPDIQEFSVDKESYVIFRGRENILEEMKLATSDGNIYLILED